jgi:hypothetical protein
MSVITTLSTVFKQIATNNTVLASTDTTTIYDDHAYSMGVETVIASDTVVSTSSIQVRNSTVLSSGSQIVALLTVFWRFGDLSLFQRVIIRSRDQENNTTLSRLRRASSVPPNPMARRKQVRVRSIVQ